jgi:hypothetical protein
MISHMNLYKKIHLYTMKVSQSNQQIDGKHDEGIANKTYP